MCPRRCLATTLLLFSASWSSVRAQGLREVVVDVRVTSQALGPNLTGSAVVASLTEALRKAAQFQFGYIHWVPAGAATDAGAPRLVLRIFDGPAVACGTPAVRFRISAELNRSEVWFKPESQLSEPCDIGVEDWTAEELVDEIMRPLEERFVDRVTLIELQKDLLSEVPLALSLEPEPDQQRLYLPLTGLLAGEGSKLVAKFGGVRDRKLLMAPIEVSGGRTRVKIVSFECDSIRFGPEAAPADWSPLLPTLLSTCLEPRIFMEEYEPDRASETTSSGLRTNLDDEGEVQP